MHASALVATPDDSDELARLRVVVSRDELGQRLRGDPLLRKTTTYFRSRPHFFVDAPVAAAAFSEEPAGLMIGSWKPARLSRTSSGPSSRSGLLHVLDAIGEEVKRSLRRNDQAHKQMIHLVHWRCDPRPTRSLSLRVGGQRLHLAPKDLVDFIR